jgi:hypothetical protein
VIEYKVGSEEHITGTLSADVVLDEQAVFVSIDRGVTWMPAVWEGVPGLRRKVRSADTHTFTTPRRGVGLAKVMDTSEGTIIELGDYKVTAL